MWWSSWESLLDHHTVHTLVHSTFLNVYTELFNFNFNYQHTTRCLDCREYIYKQLHLGQMHTSLYYSVTAHPDDGQTRPKQVSATNWENIYHLCILLVFISNSSRTSNPQSRQPHSIIFRKTYTLNLYIFSLEYHAEAVSEKPAVPRIKFDRAQFVEMP